MEKAVDNLESMFQKAETDLNYLTRKLDFQLQSEEHSSSQNNPLRLMKQIEEIRTMYTSLVQDITAIQIAQKDAVDFFRSQMLTMVQLLEKLDGQSGQKPELAEETVAQFEELAQLMGIPREDVMPASYCDQTAKAEEKTAGTSAVTESSSSSSAASSSSDTFSKAAQDRSSDKSKNSSGSVLSAYERRASSKAFIDVSKEEFLSVSELIRGRVKLDDLNRTYRMLWCHFKEEDKKEALSPITMNSMGLRVSGATGEAKLKILRALKLCQISKNGDVELT